MQLYPYSAGMVLVPYTLSAIYCKKTMEHLEAASIGIMLVVFWLVTVAMTVPLNPPESEAANPLMDFLGLAICLYSWRVDRQWWKLLLSNLFLFQLALHAQFWASWFLSHDEAIIRPYQDRISIIWVLQLIVASWPGGRCAVVYYRSQFAGRFLRRANDGGASRQETEGQ